MDLDGIMDYGSWTMDHGLWMIGRSRSRKTLDKTPKGKIRLVGGGFSRGHFQLRCEVSRIVKS